MILEYNGKSISVSEWSRETGISYRSIISRINLGWTIERALTEPVTVGRMLKHRGRTQNVTQWSRETGIGVQTILKRLNAGWTIERALTRPIQNSGRKKVEQPVEAITSTAYRNLERMMLGLKNDLQCSVKALAEAQLQAGKALAKAEKNLRASLTPGVVPNSAKIAKHRAFPVAQDRT